MVDVRRGRNGFILAASAVVVAYGISLARPVVSLVLLAGFLAITTAPLVLWLRRKKVPTLVAVLAGLTVDAAAIFAIGLVFAGAVTQLGARQGVYQERVGELLESTAAWLESYGIETSKDLIPGLSNPSELIDILGSTLKSALSLLSRLVLVLFVVAFMLLEATTLSSKLRRVLGDSDALDSVYATAHEVKAFLVVKLGTSAATGVIVGLWCNYLDVDLALLWGVIAFLLNFVPTVGSIIAGIPPVFLALILHGPGTAAAVAGGYMVVNALIGSLLEPRLLGDALGLSPLVVFLSMLSWGYLLGPVGALLSGPLTMFLKNWLRHTEDLQWVAVLLGPGREANERASKPGLLMPAPPDESAADSAAESSTE